MSPSKTLELVRTFLTDPSFETDDNHVTAVAHAAVQDVMWLEDARVEIRDIKCSFYCVDEDPIAKYPLAIVKLPPGFVQRFEAAWRRLMKEDTFQICFHKSSEGDEETKLVAEWYVEDVLWFDTQLLTLR